MCYKKLVTRVASHASAVSLLRSRKERYIKAINKQHQQHNKFSSEEGGEKKKSHASAVSPLKSREQHYIYMIYKAINNIVHQSSTTPLEI